MVIDNQSARSSLVDIAAVVVISGLAYLGELAVAEYLPWGEETRGVIAVLAGAAAAVAITLGRGDRLAHLGFRAPRRWATVPLWAVGILVVFVIAQVVAPLLIAPFYELPQADLSRYDIIRGNLPVALAAAVLLPFTAAIPEEILYRGFLIGRLTNLFGDARGAAVYAVLLQAAIFGSVHFQWGLGGIFIAAIMGAVWGFAYLLCGRNLWITIIAHSTAHLALVTQLYLTPLQ
jgi:membrane protease YdiL (CAAX protease family)